MADDKKPPAGSLAPTHVAPVPPPRSSPVPPAPSLDSGDTRQRAPTPHPELLHAPPELPLQQVDAEHYDVGDEVARGGLGRILSAHDRRLNRTVAVKVLRVRDPRAEARFMREALVTARLQHPAIVPIYEAGRWPDGEPFYAMKLLSGKSLAELVDQRPTLDGRLALLPNVIAVADAIAYAHENRVIHRDLKPQNIMIAAFGETVVIDWGLAKDLAARTPEEGGLAQTPAPSPMVSGETVAGSVLGTPAYMPPEQALGRVVDERADVYSLGAVLYHVLHGSIPLGDLTPVEAMRRVMGGLLPDLASVAPQVPEDLAAIVRKAMAHAPDQRYPSARELAADLRRFQEGQLVSVRTYAWWVPLWRWTRKHRGIVAVAAVALLALAGIGALSVERVVVERNVALAERRDADLARKTADRRKDEMVLVQAITALERDPTAALAWLKEHPGRESLAQLRTVASDAASRGAALHVLRHHEGRVVGLAFGADADQLVSAGADGRMLRWDLRDGSSHPLIHDAGVLWQLVRSPDGKTFAVMATDNQLRLVTAAGLERRFESDQRSLLALEFSPDGRSIAAGSVSGKIFLWDVETGARRELPGHAAEVRDLVFSPDGARLASAGFDGAVVVTTLATLESKALRGHRGEVWTIDFSPDGKLLASAGSDGVVRLWDAAGAPLAELRGHGAEITHLLFSPDGARLASASRDDTVRLWSAPFRDSRVLEGHTADVIRVAFAPDGKSLASASADRTVRLWDLGSTDVRVLLGHEAELQKVAFSPDGRELASAGSDGSIRVWKVDAWGQRIARGFKEARLSRFGASLAGLGEGGVLRVDRPDGTAQTVPGRGWRFFSFLRDDRLVGLDADRNVVLWDTGTAASRTLGRVPVDVGSATYASGWVACGAYDGTVRLWRTSDGAEKVWPAHKTYALDVDASPDGTLLASSGDEGEVRLWNVASGESRTLAGHVGPVHRVRFSPDGRLLASGDLSGIVRVWNVPDGTLAREDRDHGFIRTLAFSSDNTLFASSGADKTVYVRDLKTWRTTALAGAEQEVNEIAFSPDGALIAAASSDTTVRVFDWKSGAAHVLRGHRAPVTQVAFAPGGDALLSVDNQGGVRRWRREELEPLPAHRAGLGVWIDAVTTARIDAEHRPSSAR